MNPKRYFQQLKGTSGDIVTITPSTGGAKATFKLENVDAKANGDEWCFAEKIRIWFQLVNINNNASLSTRIPFIALYSLLQSFKLWCDDLGYIYTDGDLSGAQLGIIAQVISGGYKFPMFPPDDVVQATSATSLTFPIDIYLAQMWAKKGHQTGQWIGFLKNNGQLELTFAPSTILNTIMGNGAAITGSFNVSAELHYTSEPEARIGDLWVWRARSTPTGEKKHLIKNVCQGSGIKGSSGRGKIAFLAYLSNTFGLGGDTTIDQITRVYLRDRGMPSFDMGGTLRGTSSFLASFIDDTFYRRLFSSQIDTPVVGQPLTRAPYPYGPDADPESVATKASALFLPYFWPDPERQDQSKLQEWSGDYYLEQDYASASGLPVQFLALEQSYLTRQQRNFLMKERMGLDPSVFTSYPKVESKTINVANPRTDPRGAAVQQRKLRGIPQKIRPRVG